MVSSLVSDLASAKCEVPSFPHVKNTVFTVHVLSYSMLKSAEDNKSFGRSYSRYSVIVESSVCCCKKNGDFHFREEFLSV